MEQEKGIPVLPVQSEGFKGNKRAGYHAACEAMFRLVGTGDITGISPKSVNILGDFNLAGEIWIIRDYFNAWGSRWWPTSPGTAGWTTSAGPTAPP